ncbi:MAG: hypothetical protein GEV09_21600 [Pseudonocardiaceae bacterium]|nr:hypothetical protein [Pseudonocardiaceae bacterium]
MTVKIHTSVPLAWLGVSRSCCRGALRGVGQVERPSTRDHPRFSPRSRGCLAQAGHRHEVRRRPPRLLDPVGDALVVEGEVAGGLVVRAVRDRVVDHLVRHCSTTLPHVRPSVVNQSRPTRDYADASTTAGRPAGVSLGTSVSSTPWGLSGLDQIHTALLGSGCCATFRITWVWTPPWTPRGCPTPAASPTASSCGRSASRCDGGCTGQPVCDDCREVHMIAVVAKYRAAEGAAESLAAALREYTPLTRAEAGCETFVANRSRDEPREFVLYEQYRDAEAFDAHRASEHFASIAQGRIWPLLDSREVTLCDVLEP